MHTRIIEPVPIVRVALAKEAQLDFKLEVEASPAQRNDSKFEIELNKHRNAATSRQRLGIWITYLPPYFKGIS